MTSRDFEIQSDIMFWAGRLIGFDQQYEAAKEIIETVEYAKHHWIDKCIEVIEKRRASIKEVLPSEKDDIEYRLCEELIEELEKLKG